MNRFQRPIRPVWLNRQTFAGHLYVSKHPARVKGVQRFAHGAVPVPTPDISRTSRPPAPLSKRATVPVVSVNNRAQQIAVQSAQHARSNTAGAVAANAAYNLRLRLARQRLVLTATDAETDDFGMPMDQQTAPEEEPATLPPYSRNDRLPPSNPSPVGFTEVHAVGLSSGAVISGSRPIPLDSATESGVAAPHRPVAPADTADERLSTQSE